MVTHVADVRSVTCVRSQHAMEEVMVRPTLHVHKRAGLMNGGGRGGKWDEGMLPSGR